TPGEVDLAAFKAGNDVLLISENVPRAISLIVDSYDKGEITEERLEHSVKKILMAKYKVGLNNYKPINTRYLYEELNTALDHKLYEELIENAVTIVKNSNETLPIKDIKDKRFAYVNFGDDNGLPFLKQLQKYARVDWVKGSSLDDLITRL